MLAYELEHEPQNARVREQRVDAFPERIQGLLADLDYLGTGAGTARVRLGEIAGEVHRQLFSADRLQRFRVRLDGDQQEVADVLAAIARLGERPQAMREPQLIRADPRGEGFEVCVLELPPTGE